MFLKVAKELSVESHCVSQQVSCLLVRDGRIISTGLNGTPQGYINCDEKFPEGRCDEHHEWSNIHEIHAEVNAILWAAKEGTSIDKCVAYSTLKPCFNCTKALVGSGVTAIYYAEKYHRHDKKHDEMLDTFVEDNNIIIEQVVLK